MAKKDKNMEETTTEVKVQMPEKEIMKPKKKGGMWRNLAVFVILLLGGAAAFSTIQLKQTEAANKRALQDLQNKYEQKLSAITSRINGLQNEINKVKQKQDIPGGVSEEFVNGRLSELKEELIRYVPSGNKESEQVEAMVIEASPAKQTQEILLASGAIIVRDLAEQGEKFEYEAEVLQILAQGNPQAMKYVETVQKYAVSGLKGKNQLIHSFNRIFADLNIAKTKSEPEQEVENSQNWKDKIKSWAKKLLLSKKGGKRPEFKVKEDEVYTLVNEGNLSDALGVIKISEKYAGMDSSPLLQWQKQVTEYLEFNHAITGLIMNSIANLHLKEMEH